MAEAFIVQEEKSPLVGKRASERCAEVVLHHVIVAHGFERSSIQSSIAKKFVNRAVKLVCSAASHNVDLPATGSSHFRGIASRLDFELLNRIRRRAEILRVKCWIGISRYVEQKIVSIGSAATHAHRRAFTRPPVQRIHVASLSSVADVRARNGKDQINQHPAVEGKIRNRRGLDDFSYSGFVRMDCFRNTADFNRLFRRFDLQANIHGELLRDFEPQRLRRRAEPGRCDSKLIIPRLQSGDLIKSLRVSSGTADRPGRRGC